MIVSSARLLAMKTFGSVVRGGLDQKRKGEAHCGGGNRGGGRGRGKENEGHSLWNRRGGEGL